MDLGKLFIGLGMVCNSSYRKYFFNSMDNLNGIGLKIIYGL